MNYAIAAVCLLIYLLPLSLVLKAYQKKKDAEKLTVSSEKLPIVIKE